MSFYHYSICHLCKKASPDLRRCANCKVLYYCSREHQRTDWPAHKEICKAITESNKFLAFSAGSGAAEFNRFKMTTCLLWVYELGRQLKSFEHEMWLFPKVCMVCFSSEVTIVCDNCLTACYCCEEHKISHREEHDEFCEKFKQSLEIEQKLLEHETVIDCTFFLEFKREIETLPDNMEAVINAILFKNEQIAKDVLDMILLSGCFSTPINICYALEKLNFIQKRRAKKAKLVLHIVTPEMITHTNWILITEFLSHWIVNLKMLKIFLIHPSEENEQYGFTLNCKDCLKKKFSAMVLSISTEYYNCGNISRPDLVVFFDTNIRDLTGLNWKQNILKMLCHRGAPVILTAFSETQLKMNLEKFPEAQIKFYVEPQKNKYADLRPLRSGEAGGIPVVYQNNYIAILAKK